MIDTTRRILRSPHVWVFSGIVVVFWIAAALMSFYPLSTIVRCVTLWISVAVVISYGRYGLEALATPRMLRDQQLLLGICLSWLASLLQSGLIVYWRIKFPNTPINSDVITFFVLLQTLGGALHITAPGALNSQVPTRNWIILGMAIGAGVTLAWILLASLGAEG